MAVMEGAGGIERRERIREGTSLLLVRGTCYEPGRFRPTRATGCARPLNCTPGPTARHATPEAQVELRARSCHARLASIGFEGVVDDGPSLPIHQGSSELRHCLRRDQAQSRPW